MCNKWQSYDVWFLRYEAWRTEFFCHFGPFFALLPPKNQHFQKLKKTPGDIILHKCTKNHDHMLYCSWDMARDGCNYFSFWAIYCPFTTQKIKFLKNEKHLEISSFHSVLDTKVKLYPGWTLFCLSRVITRRSLIRDRNEFTKGRNLECNILPRDVPRIKT